MDNRTYKAIAIGGSAGSMDVLLRLFACLPKKFSLPIIVVCHLHPCDEGGLIEVFTRHAPLIVKEVADKELIQAGHIYFPPANYHLLVERDRTFALSIDAKVNYSRPSIDVFFESAAAVWGDELIGIILTGANKDGAAGIQVIKKHGGLTIAQDPREAAYPAMVQAAIDTGDVDQILCTEEICKFLQMLPVSCTGHVIEE
ncbi:MAG: chemotaxis protein CheB [Proteobacteria bacterium]|nr:chemotaxis protein CheB [Pseudomonadota bacterium]